jgi:four helix bundle protein
LGKLWVWGVRQELEKKRDGAEWVNFGSYRDLRVWQEAMSLAEGCFRLTREFPKEEAYGMSSQVRRSAASIAANIAEGYGRELNKPFIQFLRVAQGSLKELETHLLLVERVQMAPAEKTAPLLLGCDALGKMLRRLILSRQSLGPQAPQS